MSAIAWHPRVAKLRGYPTASKPSLPQECFEVSQKIYRSGNKSTTTVALDQLAISIFAKTVREPVKSVHNATQATRRVPFRNIQNVEKFEDLPPSLGNNKTVQRPLAKPPTEIITGQSLSPTRAVKVDDWDTPLSTSTITSTPSTPTRRYFSTGLMNTFHEHNDPMTSENSFDDPANDYQEYHSRHHNPIPRPASRRGLYRYPVESYSDPYDADANYKFLSRPGESRVEETDNEIVQEESDIGEACPFDYDAEKEDVTQEFIRMLNFP